MRVKWVKETGQTLQSLPGRATIYEMLVNRKRPPLSYSPRAIRTEQREEMVFISHNTITRKDVKEYPLE